jgi:hypothetical protein
MDVTTIERALDDRGRLGARIKTDDLDYVGWLVLRKQDSSDFVFLLAGDDPWLVRSEEEVTARPYRIHVVELRRATNKSDTSESTEESQRNSIHRFSTLAEAEVFLEGFQMQLCDLEAMTDTLHEMTTEDGHRITIVDCVDHPLQDNVDIGVVLSDGRRYVGTLFTLSNVAWLLEKYKEAGEGAQGLYLWATDMVLVREITPEVVLRTVRGLIQEGDLDRAFTFVDDEALYGT